MYIKSQDPWARMENWNKTFEAHHIPVWFKKLIRAFAKTINYGRVRTGLENDVIDRHPDISHPHFWDHYGSVIMPGNTERTFITQPYNGDDLTALFWADKLGCQVNIYPGGIWAEGAYLYEYHPLPVNS